MKPDDAPVPRCGVDEQQLMAYLDGELQGAAGQQFAAHLAECPSCAATAEAVAFASEALGVLPELRCPDHVAAAADEAARVSPIEPKRFPLVARFATAAAVAASLAIVALWSAEPTPRLTEAERQKLVAVQRVVGTKTAVAGIQALDRGVVRPTRQVIATISDGPLGRWGDRATSFFQQSEASPADPT